MHYHFRVIPGKMTIKWCICLIPPQILGPILRETPWSSTPSPSPWGSQGQTLAPENVDTPVDPRSAWHCARLLPARLRSGASWTHGLAKWNLVGSSSHWMIPKNFNQHEQRIHTTYVYIYIHTLYIYITYIYKILNRNSTVVLTQLITPHRKTNEVYYRNPVVYTALGPHPSPWISWSPMKSYKNDTQAVWIASCLIWLVVSTHLKRMSKILDHFSRLGWK